MLEICGTCKTWKPPVFRQVSNLKSVSEEAKCKIFGKAKDVDTTPESWCWTQASSEQIQSRVKAGLINNEHLL